MKRERLFNAYKVILNAADKYQFETQQINHMPSAVNISLDGLDEAVTEITLEDIDFGVLSIFFDLRGAFNEFTARLHMPEEGSWEEVLKHKHKCDQEEGHPNLSALSSVLTKVDNDTKAREL